MLVLDPAKRYTIQQVRNHRWIQEDGGPPKSLPPSPVIGAKGQVGEFSEYILRQMHSNGIDQQHTIEVSSTCISSQELGAIYLPSIAYDGP